MRAYNPEHESEMDQKASSTISHVLGAPDRRMLDATMRICMARSGEALVEWSRKKNILEFAGGVSRFCHRLGDIFEAFECRGRELE